MRNGLLTSANPYPNPNRTVRVQCACPILHCWCPIPPGHGNAHDMLGFSGALPARIGRRLNSERNPSFSHAQQYIQVHGGVSIAGRQNSGVCMHKMPLPLCAAYVHKYLLRRQGFRMGAASPTQHQPGSKLELSNEMGPGCLFLRSSPILLKARLLKDSVTQHVAKMQQGRCDLTIFPSCGAGWYIFLGHFSFLYYTSVETQGSVPPFSSHCSQRPNYHCS